MTSLQEVAHFCADVVVDRCVAFAHTAVMEIVPPPRQRAIQVISDL